MEQIRARFKSIKVSENSFKQNQNIKYTWEYCYIHSGVTESEPGQVHVQGFWAQNLAWIKKKLILLLWYISYSWCWSDYEV